MPIYEFKCPSGHVTEKILPVGSTIKSLHCDHPDTKCPEFKCSTVAMKVEFSQTSPPRLVGEGFYKPSTAGPLVNGTDPTKVIKQIDVGKGGNASLQITNNGTN